MAVLFFVIGCCLGSFINVMLSRKDWYKGRSRCDCCGGTLEWYDLIPIISFCILRGRCRKCHSKIEVLHLVSEIYMGCGFIVAYLYFQYDTMTAVCITAAIVFLGVFAISDTKETAVSVIYLYGGITAVAFLRSLCILNQGNPLEIITFIFINGLIYIGFWIVQKKTKNNIGEGDFDILMLILLAAGFLKTIICITVACTIGTCLYLPLMVNKKIDRTKHIPFAPLLYVGFLITLMGGI